MTSATRERERDYTWTSPSWAMRLRTPTTTLYVLVGSVVLMVSFGLMMVLSASAVRSYRESGSAYAVFADQAKFVVIGSVLTWVAANVPPEWWRRLAWPGLVLGLVLQGLVLSPLGVSVMGNRNQIAVGPISIQPSEFSKLALVVFGAAVLSRKWRLMGSFFHAIVPFVLPAAAGVLGLVLWGRDLGTALVIASLVVGMLFVSGIRLWWFLVLGSLGAAGAGALVVTSPNRMHRITTWLTNPCVDPQASGCWQSAHGKFALADGGWWGVGLGESREKWSWLAEPHNDFILAVIGEELGLPGTLAVLAMFFVLAWACYRLVASTQDMFIRLASVGVMVWVTAQASINIGSVIGAMPIVGVPLPLISSGGSSLIATMVALGMLISFARHHPEVRAARGLRPRGPVRRRLGAMLDRRKVVS